VSGHWTVLHWYVLKASGGARRQPRVTDQMNSRNSILPPGDYGNPADEPFIEPAHASIHRQTIAS
jgi:hypothetical protein